MSEKTRDEQLCSIIRKLSEDAVWYPEDWTPEEIALWRRVVRGG